MGSSASSWRSSSSPSPTSTRKTARSACRSPDLQPHRGALSTFQSSLVGLEDASAYTASSASGRRRDCRERHDDRCRRSGQSHARSHESGRLAAPQVRHSFPGTHRQRRHRHAHDQVRQLRRSDQNLYRQPRPRLGEHRDQDSAHSSLSGVRDAINAANVGVGASIINDGTGFRLVVASKVTPARKTA